MISFDQARKACDRLRITVSNLQLANLLHELLPNPQTGFSCGGVNVWGDPRSIDAVRRWQHATRTEELTIKLLDFVLRVSAANPAHVGSYRNLAVQLLEDHNIEPRKGFYVSQDAALADARTKLYAATLP